MMNRIFLRSLIGINRIPYIRYCSTTSINNNNNLDHIDDDFMSDWILSLDDVYSYYGKKPTTNLLKTLNKYIYDKNFPIIHNFNTPFSNTITEADEVP